MDAEYEDPDEHEKPKRRRKRRKLDERRRQRVLERALQEKKNASKDLIRARHEARRDMRPGWPPRRRDE